MSGTENDYTPPDNSFAYIKEGGESILVYVARRATQADKIKYVIDSERHLKAQDGMTALKLNRRSLKNFFKNPDIFVCIEDQDIMMIKRDLFIGPVLEESSPEQSPTT